MVCKPLKKVNYCTVKKDDNVFSIRPGNHRWKERIERKALTFFIFICVNVAASKMRSVSECPAVWLVLVSAMGFLI